MSLSLIGNDALHYFLLTMYKVNLKMGKQSEIDCSFGVATD